jgi:hypothetical protein
MELESGHCEKIFNNTPETNVNFERRTAADALIMLVRSGERELNNKMEGVVSRR